MASQWRDWMLLVATVWLQAFTGTNFDFSAYSSELKSVTGMSQLHLNYISVASDLGKAFGWCSGLSLRYFPLPFVLLAAALAGLFAYGLQWLLIRGVLSMPYALLFILCLLAGCTICWFNTVCYVLCLRSFPSHRPLALSLTTSFNSLTAALYGLIANSIAPRNAAVYLLLNAVLPLLASAAALPAILRRTDPEAPPPPPDPSRREPLIFLLLNLLAALTGLYLLLFHSQSSVSRSIARILLAGALFLLLLPILIPGAVYAWKPPIRLAGTEDPEMVYGELMSGENDEGPPKREGGLRCFDVFTAKDRITVLGEEHSPAYLVRRWDFWLYYAAYFCGGTVGLVYSNNLGQISQSLGYASETNSVVTIYSTCSFFGRLLSAAPDLLPEKVYFARTGWVAAALVLTPVAFFDLALSGTMVALQTSTVLIGLSSGFVFAAAVSVTSELFGPGSLAVNHNILITNIPIGSVLYGLQAAVVYDWNAGSSAMGDDPMVCMGRRCYERTFMWWGCISVVGWVFGWLLYVRTKPAYVRFH